MFIFKKNKKIFLEDLQNELDAIGIEKDYKNLDPKIQGPGIWFLIHKFGFNAETESEQKEFIKLIKKICLNFPCNVCKTHFIEYIKNHPMEEYLGTVIEINMEKQNLGMFIWTWRFHNAVNTRLNKKNMSWDTAYNLYSEKSGLTCTKSCSESI